MYHSLSIAAVVAGIASSALASAVNNNSQGPPPLKFNEDGTFQINVFEDLHFGDRRFKKSVQAENS